MCFYVVYTYENTWVLTIETFYTHIMCVIFEINVDWYMKDTKYLLPTYIS